MYSGLIAQNAGNLASPRVYLLSFSLLCLEEENEKIEHQIYRKNYNFFFY